MLPFQETRSEEVSESLMLSLVSINFFQEGPEAERLNQFVVDSLLLISEALLRDSNIEIKTYTLKTLHLIETKREYKR